MKNIGGRAIEVFEITPQPKPRKWRSGLGVVAYSDSGELFINSEIVGMSAQEAFLCCSYDGQPFAAHGSKVLVSSEWAMREKPHLKNDISLLVRMAGESTSRMRSSYKQDDDKTT